MQWQDAVVIMEGKREKMATKRAEELQEEEGYHKTVHRVI
jgi:hypothetical protein